MGFTRKIADNAIASISATSLASFTEKQMAAWRATKVHRYVLYGGARGGGKSRFLRWWCVLWLIWIYHTTGLTRVRVMLACETYRDLADRQITKIKTEFPLWIGQLKSTEADGLCFFLNDNLGGGIVALRNLDEPAKYQSAEFAAIVVDELTKILKPTFDILRGSMRWPGLEHTVFLAATNPGGPGHAWVKQLWIDRDFPPELIDKAFQFSFVQSLPADNPHLTQSYWDELNSLPEELRKAWVEGDWTIFAGQFFDRWRESVHIVKPFTLPYGWKLFAGIDYGTTRPFCCLFGAVDFDKNIWIYREIYAAGLTAKMQAARIREVSHNERIEAFVADPSMVNIKNIAVGNVFHSISDFYSTEGIPLIAGNNDRIHGWNAVREYLEWTDQRGPRIKVFSTCKNLTRTLPIMQYDEHKPEDMDSDLEDHPVDALRYLVMYVYEPTKKHIDHWSDKGYTDHDALVRESDKRKAESGAQFV